MVFELMNVFGDFVRIEKMIMFDNLGVINEWVRGLWWFKGCKLVLILEVNFYFKKYFDINEKWAKVIFTIHWPIVVHCMVVDDGGLNGVDKTR